MSKASKNGKGYGDGDQHAQVAVGDYAYALGDEYYHPDLAGFLGDAFGHHLSQPNVHSSTVVKRSTAPAIQRSQVHPPVTPAPTGDRPPGLNTHQLPVSMLKPPLVPALNIPASSKAQPPVQADPPPATPRLIPSRPRVHNRSRLQGRPLPLPLLKPQPQSAGYPIMLRICNQCSRSRKGCSREYPSCAFCSERKLVCHYGKGSYPPDHPDFASKSQAKASGSPAEAPLS